jgi:hypothetical protein
MPGRRVSHSESRWVQLPHTVIRCNGTLQSGKRCRREAIEGSVVCEVHGGLAPQVRRRAAERLLVAADEAIQVIKSFVSDPTVPAGVRLKAAQDIADRAGLAGVQMHQIIPVKEDPLERFFNNMGPDAWITRGPDGREYTQDQLLARAFPESADAIESGQSNQSDGELTPEEYRQPYDEPETILDAEIVDEPELEAVNGDDSPARIRQMIRDRAFDRKPGQ